MRKFAATQGSLIVAEIAGDASIRKAAAKVLGVPQQRLFKEGHRVTFPDVIRREGYLYVINRAISSRTNENYDTWPAEEIATTAPGLGYQTFVGKPIFVEHANDNHRRTRGVNLAAALHEDHNPDGSPDTWVSVLKEVDPVKFPKLAQAILAGRVNRTSMGADVGNSICSKCGNIATSPAEYCAHIPGAKGAIFEDMDRKTGAKRHGLVSEICRKVAFFEDTFITSTPADPTAYILTTENLSDVRPSGSSQHSPYGHGADSVAAGQRLQPFTSSGPNREHIILGKPGHPVSAASGVSASGVAVSDVVGRGAKSPVARVLTDADVTSVANHQARRDRSDKGLVAPSMGVDLAPTGGRGSRKSEPPVAVAAQTSSPRPAGVRTTGSINLGDVPLHLSERFDSTSGHDHQSTAKDATLHEAELARELGGLREGMDYYHFPDSRGGKPGADLHLLESNWDGPDRPGHALHVQHQEGDPNPYSVVYVHPRGEDLLSHLDGEGDSRDRQKSLYFGPDARDAARAAVQAHMHLHRLLGPPNHQRPPEEHFAKLMTTAAKELTLPPRIDTLQNTTCPVCGSENSFHGNRCSVCNSVKPPDALMDPDTSVAPKVQQMIEDNLDPAEDVDDLDDTPGADLMCPECGSQFTSQFKDEAEGNPYLVPAENQAEPADEELGEEEAELGDEAEDQDGQEQNQPEDDEEQGDEDTGPEKPPVADADDLDNEQDQSDYPPDEDDPEAELEEDAEADEEGLSEGAYSAGDVCPACGEGVLEPMEDDVEDGPEAVPVEGEEAPEDGLPEDGEEDPVEGEDEDDDSSPYSDDDEDDEDESEDGDQAPPFKKKQSALTLIGRNTSTMPQARKPSGRTTPKANPAGVQRTALLEALQVHAQRQEEDHAAIARVASVITRQAQVIQALAARNETLERQMAHLAAASPAEHQKALIAIGKEGYRKVASIYRQANPANPAQPIMEPPPEQPVVTEQQAMMPGSRDDVTQLGATPMSDVSADATIAVDQPYGEYANVPVGLNRVDVTAPVDGTQYQRPPSETIIPVDVRVGNPDNPQPAFPWTLGPVGTPGPQLVGPSVGNPPVTASSGNKRAFATLHLAKLQIQAGIASGDDLEIAASLDASEMSDSDIQNQIQTLSKVVEANKKTAAVTPEAFDAPTRRLVPKAASYAKSMPSLQSPTASLSGPNPNAPRALSVGSVSADELAFE